MTRGTTRERAVCVVGLGYVGCVLAASTAARGRRVIGVDRRAAVVDALARGIAPIAEPGLAERIARSRMLGTLSATTDLADAVAHTDAALVCVGTPVAPDGQLDETDVLDACEAIARSALHAHPDRSYAIVIRSTVPPGLYGRAAARVRAVVGDGFGTRVTLALNPEFLREGSAVRDLEEPELVVYATEHEGAAAFLQDFYRDHHDRVVRTDPATSEVLKLVANAWHALKVVFANEVARVTAPLDVDPFAVMDLLCRDTRLNTSAAYLRPGMPFGGACLTKDVASIDAHARAHGLDTPVIGAILASNRAHLAHLRDAVLAHRPRRVAIVGIGFKPGAADVRDSAPVRLVQALLDAGVEVTVADGSVLAASVPPLGIEALRAALGDPRARAAASIAEAVADADVIVAAHPSAEDRAALVALRPTLPLIDAAGELTRALSDDERTLLAPVIALRRR